MENTSQELTEFTVERIEDKRTIRGKVQYFLKWKGFPDTENSWEPMENLNCPELVSAYEEDIKIKGTRKRPRSPYDDNNVTYKRQALETTKHSSNIEGFDGGLKPSKILGATESKEGELMFLMKWEGSDIVDLVPAKQANVKCPQMVIRYYEEQISWLPANIDNEDSNDSKGKTA